MLSALRRIFNSKHTFQMIAPISAATCRSVMLFALASLFAGISGAAEPKVFDGMIRIPAGIFVMGRSDGPEDERPEHKVNLDEFFIDQNQVTNSQFGRFLNAVGPQGRRGENIMTSTTTTPASIAARESGWPMPAMKIAQLWKRHGSVLQPTARGQASAYRRKRSGRRRRVERTDANIPGEMSRRTARAPISIPAGTISAMWEVFLKARVRTACSIWRAMVGSG
jgi:formylglycine-generating enzyme required for sulfatase activity